MGCVVRREKRESHLHRGRGGGERALQQWQQRGSLLRSSESLPQPWEEFARQAWQAPRLPWPERLQDETPRDSWCQSKDAIVHTKTSTHAHAHTRTHECKKKGRQAGRGKIGGKRETAVAAMSSSKTQQINRSNDPMCKIIRKKRGRARMLVSSDVSYQKLSRHDMTTRGHD